MVLHEDDLFSFHIVSRIAIRIDPSRKTLRPSSFDTSSTNQDDVEFESVDVKFKSAHETLDDRDAPHGVEFVEILLQIVRPVEEALILSAS